MQIRIPKLVNQLEKVYKQLIAYDTPIEGIRTPTINHMKRMQSIARNIADALSKYVGVETESETTQASNSDDFAQIWEEINKLKEAQASTLQNTIETKMDNTTTNNTEVSTAITTVVNQTTEIASAKNLNDINSKSNPTDISRKKSYFGEYDHTLYNLRHMYRGKKKEPVEQSTGYYQVDQLLDIFSLWFNSRIKFTYNKQYGVKATRHNYAQINEGLYSFVILYGYYMEHPNIKTTDDFYNEMCTWVEDTLPNDKYALEHFLHPVNVKEFITDTADIPKEEFFTESALILWDLLLKADSGKLREFCIKYNMYDDALKIQGINELYEEYAPEILEEYQGTLDTEYIESLGFVKERC